ncbi:type IV pilin protein [Cupriavidus pampae]|uniref:Prepilin-type N-terminal cleavage/methylation domain-containing protein n=1 Tax=Cupriavidus pampae TaxID=659251 RepID=A0ABN7YC91_9BURK|nr:type IV pilin protein [Cupriavidus pampae]CAG9169497.1 hypothetical protein LMG32289_01699 [Cupriavidus pampae]
MNRSLLPSAGFTLIELVTVIVIVGLLSAFAYPQYIQQTRRADRADASAALLSAMQQFEQHYSDTSSYYQPKTNKLWDGYRKKSESERHALSAKLCGAANGHCVEIRATPVRADEVCGALVLRSTGERLIWKQDRYETRKECW